MDIQELVRAQRAYFLSGATRSYAFRMEQLKKLQQALRSNEALLEQAMYQDFRKAPMEVYMCETGMVLEEVRFHLKHLKGWMRERTVPTPLAQFPARSFIRHDPMGVALIMSPWNYPFLLTIEPLLGALAGGNCCILKPSKDAPATSAIIQQICAECFPLEEVAVVEGGRTENQALLDQPFDKIFFTGSSHVGQEVLRRAAEHLTPVTLELGGKSPVIVAKDADLTLAARRIAFGKLLNAGQTCVAPDYVLVAREVEDAFVSALQKQFDQLCPDPLHSAEYVRIVNQKHFDRLTGLMASGQIVYGGSIDPAALRIAPTILRNVSPDSPVMQEEIFGPILPMLEFDRLDELVGLHSFDDCALYGYALKLQLLERQRIFRHDEGKAAFDTLLGQVRQQIFSL